MSELEVDFDDVPAQPRRTAAILVPALVVIAVVGFIVVVLATREPAANRIVRSPLVGQQAPAIQGLTMQGDEYDLVSERGRFVLVNFFATWCAPCRQEHDDLARWDQRHRAIGDAGVVTIVFEDSTEAARAFFEEEGGDWPILAGDDGDLALDYGVVKVPESYLIGPDGTVLAKIAGGVTDAGLDDLLARVQAPSP